MSTVQLPLVPAVRPAWTATAQRQALLVGIGVLAIALLAQVRIEIGPVPITGQTLPVLLLPFALGTRLAATTVAAYLAIGIAGAPVFSGGAGGWATFSGATMGYLVGFLLAALVVGALGDRGWHRSPGLVVAGMALGNVVVYAVGLSWLGTSLDLSPTATLAAGLTPFLVGDALKIAIGAALLPAVQRLAGDA